MIDDMDGILLLVIIIILVSQQILLLWLPVWLTIMLSSALGYFPALWFASCIRNNSHPLGLESAPLGPQS